MLREKLEEKASGLSPKRNSSPPYRWDMPFTRLKKGDFFRKYVKVLHLMYFSLIPF